MLSLIEEGRHETVGPATEPGGELTGELARELGLIQDLRHALLVQRASVAAGDSQAVEASVHAVARTLFTLAEARRRRLILTAAVADGQAVVLPEALIAAREALRQMAATTATEVAANQHLLRRAAEAGDAFLQQLFAGSDDVVPAQLREGEGG